jgi:Na+-driven multidrug efflux pump
LLGCIYILSDALRGLGYPLIRSLAEIVGLCVTVVGLLIALPLYGINGAAWVSVIAYSVVVAILFSQLIRLFRQNRADQQRTQTDIVD